MSRFRLTAGLLILAASAAQAADLPAAEPAQPAAATPTWVAIFSNEARYYSWQGSRGYPTDAASARGGGSEFYDPFALQLVGRPSNDFKIELIGRGGWVQARQSTAGLSGSVSTMTDTTLSGTVTYLGMNGIQPFVSLSGNLPTGRSSLPGSAANARMDPDLVEVSSFGEGFNIGPTVGFNLPLTAALIATFSTGYTWRGQFEQEGGLAEDGLPVVQSPTAIKPGDDLSWTASLAYASGPLSTSLTGSITRETTTFQDGAPIYQAGLRYLLAGSASYVWPGSWGATTLTASGAHADNDKVKFLQFAPLLLEPADTNSNVYRTGIQHLFPVGKLSIGPAASYLFRDHNGYDAATLQFVPAKQRYSAGLVAQFSANDRVTFNAHVDCVWTHEDDNPAPGGVKYSTLADAYFATSSVPVVSSVGWQTSIGMNVSF
ncbi:hypothetical protein [Methylocapsa sp. S129]|uniref:hypothetical protein n=1 Tax=Methylocapsa sp. S129 TaxID=1641869 RepID=UPI00131EBC01|nr:hypothetical protein [Methylocapsa sp. S129]